MAGFVKGMLSSYRFRFLTQAKRRPALVAAVLPGDDLILCQITSQVITDQYAVVIAADDFSSGGLKQNSNARPNRLFTVDRQLIPSTAGQLKREKLDEVITKIIDILHQ